MKNIDLGTVLQDAAHNEFWALRARAIQGYSNLEQSLFSLFVSLTGMKPTTAGIIFFKITNAQARNGILEKLFHDKHGSNFNLFRNSLIKQLRPLDIERNELVHWNTVTLVDGNGFKALTLKPPDFWSSPEAPTHDAQSLVAFMNKCSFYARLINMFCVVGTPDAPDFPHVDDAVKRPWIEIFSQPITYPPPSGHPLSLRPSAPAPS